MMRTCLLPSREKRLCFRPVVSGTAVSVGATVAVAWALLALSRRWESEPGWIDRLGRLVGVAAISAALPAFTQFGI